MGGVFCYFFPQQAHGAVDAVGSAAHSAVEKAVSAGDWITETWNNTTQEDVGSAVSLKASEGLTWVGDKWKNTTDTWNTTTFDDVRSAAGSRLNQGTDWVAEKWNNTTQESLGNWGKEKWGNAQDFGKETKAAWENFGAEHHGTPVPEITSPLGGLEHAVLNKEGGAAWWSTQSESVKASLRTRWNELPAFSELKALVV